MVLNGYPNSVREWFPGGKKEKKRIHKADELTTLEIIWYRSLESWKRTFGFFLILPVLKFVIHRCSILSRGRTVELDRFQ